MLIITKEPEFDEHNDAVLGQCELFTSDWSLFLVDVSGKREKLIMGAYSDLCKIQKSCASLDEIEAIRKRVMELRMLLNTSVIETGVVKSASVEADDIAKENSGSNNLAGDRQ
ncbi:MAG: hypothetical protein V1899_06485 [Planctomycetota bacterium]